MGIKDLYNSRRGRPDSSGAHLTPRGIVTVALTIFLHCTWHLHDWELVLLNPSLFPPTKLQNPDGKTGQDMKLQIISLLNNKVRILNKILANRSLRHIFKNNTYQVKFIAKMQG